MQLLPIPFLDLTTSLEDWLPAAPIALSFNLGLVFIGFVLPWRICVGMFASTLLFQIILNPIFQRVGWLPSWQSGKGAIDTNIANTIDLYLSLGIGVSFSVLAVGLWGIAKALRNRKKAQADSANGFNLQKLWQRDRLRGDPPTWLPLVIWIAVSICYIAFSNYLVNAPLPAEERFSIWWLIAFAFLWTPLNTYINARMSGIAGQNAGVPYVTEAAIFTSKHRGVGIWFAPLPIANYGYMADLLRETQLTRTRFTSLWKVEILIFPIMIIASFAFWSYITGLGPVPSEKYPYAQQFWPQYATMQGLWAASMQEGQSLLLDSLNPIIMAAALVVSLILFGVFGAAGISVQYLYGGLTTITTLPHMAFPIFIGACLGRFYLAKKFGTERWTNYAPILAVGFAAGVGLIGMLSIAINFLWTSIGQ